MIKNIRPYIFQFILVLIWLGIQLYLWQSLGIKVMTDSYRYLSFSKYITDYGIDITSHSSRYISYSIFLAFCLHFNQSLLLAISLQIIISGLALVSLYSSVLHLTKDKLCASLTALFFILWIEISSWNFYILTESLFISLTIIIFYLLIFSCKKYHFFLFLLLFGLITLRPNGFIPVVATGVYFYRTLWIEYPKKRHLYTLLTIIFLLFNLVLLNNYLLRTFKILEVYNRGDIIFGYWDLLIKPNSPKLPTTHFPLLNLIIFFLQNIPYFIQAGFLKVFYFLAHTKPFYSVIHNIYISIFLFPIYVFALLNKFNKEPPFLFIYTIIGLQTIMVFLTTEDWDGRFLMPILPFIFILSAKSITEIIRKHGKFKKYTK